MTEIATHSGGLEIRDRYLDPAPAGSILFHAQLYPYDYPSDAKRKAELHSQGRPLSELVMPEYLDFVERTIRRGVRLCRLVVALGNEDEGYDSDRLHEYREVFAGVQRLGETVRITAYGRQIIRMQEACGPDSSLAHAYQRGIEQRVPTGSFWSVYTDSPDAPQNVHTIALMHYSADGKRMSGPVHASPFDPKVREYETFWRGVFHSPTESQPLS